MPDLSVQEEVGRDEKATGGVVLPRTAFLHSATQLHCPLFLPWPGDQVLVDDDATAILKLC